MTAESRNVVLCWLLSDTRAEGALAAFVESCDRLFDLNPLLEERLRSVQLLAYGEDQAEAIALCEGAAKHLAATRASTAMLQLAGDSLGRCLNDAFLALVHAEGALHWLVWDSKHRCTRPFLRSADAVLRSPEGAQLWQLMLSEDCAATVPAPRLLERDGHRVMLPATECSASAPSFTLAPAWHRLRPLQISVLRRRLSSKPFEEGLCREEVLRRFGVTWRAGGAVSAQLLPPPARLVVFEASELPV